MKTRTKTHPTPLQITAKHRAGWLAVAAGLLVATARAQILVSFSFSPSLAAGADPAGLVGSTMTVAATIAPGATYVAGTGAATGIPYAPFTVATVTITGAGVPANNGTFALQNTVSLGAFPKLFGGAELFTGNDGATHSTALLGVSGVQYELFDFAVAASFVPAFSAAVGDPVLASDFDGATLLPGQTFSAGYIDTPEGIYGIPGGIQISAVPEPAGFGVGGGVGLLAWGMRRRIQSRRPERETNR
ncbi:MAG: hypothetical protein KDM81_18765 [Verrucomicrobiae bacterium]|nr:hypothetical protein [Verrucomicrobiae bacterium]